MVSSVSVDDSLRKKIKQLAAELDTTQGEIVAKGINLLEKSMRKQPNSQEHPAREKMRIAAERRENVKWRQQIREKLQNPGLPIEEVIITNWGGLVED